MNTTPAEPPVQLVPFDADRHTLAAFLDASPLWERYTWKTQRRTGYQTWRLAPTTQREVYGEYVWDARATLYTDDSATAHPSGDESYCAETALAINAVALRLPPNTEPDVIERFVAIYLLNEPSSATALIASGQVEPR
ncbi:hypothetical protein ACGFJC_47710 [Nonomuraea fuscirosea]|uniref:hypothetical protein n=1 Tax=Nonomuraea fuscirosea TaxID=1291556 RepID=UPI0037153256